MKNTVIEKNKTTQQDVESLLRRLVSVWVEFESKLNTVPIIDKMNRQKMRVEDYQLLLLNQRQQVIEGARWIARAASNVTEEYMELRSTFLKHAVTEHQDYQMLENNYVAVGGSLADIQSSGKNIGSEALSAWMFNCANKENPFELLGAMFIIEGLGQNMASEWGASIRDQLGLTDDQVGFYLYHGEHDDEHMEQFEEALQSGILEIEGMADRIVKNAKVTARLYALQLEELGNV